MSKIKTIFINRNRKYTINYQSYGYMVGVSVEIDENEDFDRMHLQAINKVNKLMKIEEDNIKKEVE